MSKDRYAAVSDSNEYTVTDRKADQTWDLFPTKSGNRDYACRWGCNKTTAELIAKALNAQEDAAEAIYAVPKNPTEWNDARYLLIKKEPSGEVLIEYPDGARQWIDNSEGGLMIEEKATEVSYAVLKEGEEFPCDWGISDSVTKLPIVELNGGAALLQHPDGERRWTFSTHYFTVEKGK